MKTFVIGDIHGAHQALLNCFNLSGFDKTQDRLICLGDVCDRGRQVKECIDELLKIPHLVYILGNHDAWSLEWGVTGKIIPEWRTQGGAQTVKSYKKGMPKEHIEFLSNAPRYFVDNNRLFTHGGFDPEQSIETTPQDFFFWDRSLLRKAQEKNLIDPNTHFGNYNEVYVGHTPTQNFGNNEPQKFCNVWAMDTGAGWGNRLTIMDTDTKEFWQSKV